MPEVVVPRPRHRRATAAGAAAAASAEEDFYVPATAALTEEDFYVLSRAERSIALARRYRRATVGSPGGPGDGTAAGREEAPQWAPTAPPPPGFAAGGDSSGLRTVPPRRRSFMEESCGIRTATTQSNSMFSNSMYSGATYFQSAHAMHSNSMYSNPSTGLALQGLNAGPARGAGAPGEYRLGDVARTPRDMVVLRDPAAAVRSVARLQKMDRAFLKRPNGLWTCAVLADRAPQPVAGTRWRAARELGAGDGPLEDSMLFVMDEDGATKIVRERHWGTYVRRLRGEDGEAPVP